MKKKISYKPIVSKFSILYQLCKFIPPHLVPKLARDTGVEEHARTFGSWSQVVSLLYAQLTHALGLNDVCDTLRLHFDPLSALRDATPSPKNTFSYANRTRDPNMAQKLFRAMFEHLQTLAPRFASHLTPHFAFPFKRLIHIVDATTITLMTRSLNWDKHRWRKTAAKCHVRLNLQSFMPGCVIASSTAEHDNVRARELCSNTHTGEIVIFDKAYFSHLANLSQREVFWGTRVKNNLQLRVLRKWQDRRFGNLLRDDLITLTGPADRGYPVVLRRVVALVEVDGQFREMKFLTNHSTWSAQTIADLYRYRWNIETFFKKLKQILQLADFLGHNANAMRWQIWKALLAYLLLRFCLWLRRWKHSFTLLFGLICSALWQKFNPRSLLENCRTAPGGGCFLSRPEQAYLPGFG